MRSSFSTGAPEPDPTKYEPLPFLLEYAWLGDTAKVRMIVDDDYSRGRFLDEIDERTGMNALHIAVGRNNLEVVKLLVDAGIQFIPDKEGRMPSLIAALCDASEELQDYIAEAEEKALAEKDQAG
jgi:ankyrin repeat protein